MTETRNLNKRKVTVIMAIALLLLAVSFGYYQLKEAEAITPEKITTVTNGRTFTQGDPIAVLTQGTIVGTTRVNLDNPKSEYAGIEGPCGIPYLDFAFLRGAYPNISTYEDLLALKSNALNVRYPHTKDMISCQVYSTGILSVEISPAITKVNPPELTAQVEPKIMVQLFPDVARPTLTYSPAIVSYNDPEKGKVSVDYILLDSAIGITKYYDVEVIREQVAPDEVRVYRASHPLEPGEYTIVGFTMSGSVSKPVVITVLPEGSIPPTTANSISMLTFAPNLPLLITAMVGVIIPFGMFIRGGEFSALKDKIPKKFALTAILSAILLGTSFASMPAYGAWDKGAQGIQVSNTAADYNVAILQTDQKGWKSLGTSDGTGTGSMNSAFLSGQTTGTNYLWSNAANLWRAASSTYNSYTCSTWPSGTFTCQYVNSIVYAPRQEFITDKTGGFPNCNDGSAGAGFWTYDSVNQNCYKRHPDPVAEYTFNIGAGGYKRFDMNGYMTLQSDGKVHSILKFRRCTSDAESSCGFWVTRLDYTSPTLTSSNQKFTSGVVGGTTYYPNGALVGHSGGSSYTAQPGTFVELTYDATDSSGSPTASFKRCAPSTGAGICNAPAEGNTNLCWWSPIGTTGVAKQYKSSAKYDTACQSDGP
ncbi:MAG: hypothetical protein QXN83_09660 [Nitrososphaerales archaeon]